ncbi:MAG: ADP-ribosylglycohydrolase family protein [Nocardioidaceae bacterium]
MSSADLRAEMSWPRCAVEASVATHLQDALHEAIRVGHDTDTVAAIAGGLLGARWDASAVPARWSRQVHG